MLQYDFENSIGFWIFSAAHELTRVMNEELAEHGITFRQWQVLAWLSFLGEVSQSEVADNMGIEAPTLVGVLDRMERDGWIERVTDPRDRRRKIIRPTERVEPVWAKMVECAMRVRQRATRGLTAEQLADLQSTLASVKANFADRRAEKAAPAAAADRN
jgi:MarR family transcriptional regulator for hemolysin